MLSKLFVVNKVPSIQISDKKNSTNDNRTNIPESKISEAKNNVTMETHATLVQLTDAVLSQRESTKSKNNTLDIWAPTKSMNDEND